METRSNHRVCDKFRLHFAPLRSSWETGQWLLGIAHVLWCQFCSAAHFRGEQQVPGTNDVDAAMLDDGTVVIQVFQLLVVTALQFKVNSGKCNESQQQNLAGCNLGVGPVGSWGSDSSAV